MFQYLIAFVVAALFAWFVAMSSTQPLATKAVAVEGVRAARMDDETFRLRWSDVALMPPTREVIDNSVLLVTHEAPLMAAAGATVRPPLRARKVSLRHRDVCARHGMRRVHYGRTWRCRR